MSVRKHVTRQTAAKRQPFKPALVTPTGELVPAAPTAKQRRKRQHAKALSAEREARRRETIRRVLAATDRAALPDNVIDLTARLKRVPGDGPGPMRAA